MSDATLIRVWTDYTSDAVNVFVDWDDGHFSLPADHLVSKKLWGDANRLNYRVTVYSSDELEWVVDTVSRTSDRKCHIVCIPRLKQLRACLRSDEYLIEAWISAEKEWKRGAEALARDIARARGYQAPWYDLRFADRQECLDQGRRLIDFGWRKGEPT